MVRLPPAPLLCLKAPTNLRPTSERGRHVEKPLKLSLAGSQSRDVVDDDVGFVQAPLG